MAHHVVPSRYCHGVALFTLAISRKTCQAYVRLSHFTI